jgi:hypothetical protein
VLRRHRLVRLEVRKARSLGLAIDPDDGADYNDDPREKPLRDAVYCANRRANN